MPREEAMALPRRLSRVPVALCVATAVWSTGARASMCGDLNGDGRLTIADAVRLLKATIAPNPADCGSLGSAQCGDVDRVDGVTLGLGDVLLLLNHLAGNAGIVPLCMGDPTHVCTPSPGAGPGGETWSTRATLSGYLN